MLRRWRAERLRRASQEQAIQKGMAARASHQTGGGDANVGGVEAAVEAMDGEGDAVEERGGKSGGDARASWALIRSCEEGGESGGYEEADEPAR